jgi:hypothetical protein
MGDFKNAQIRKDRNGYEDIMGMHGEDKKILKGRAY